MNHSKWYFAFILCGLLLSACTNYDPEAYQNNQAAKSQREYCEQLEEQITKENTMVKRAAARNRYALECSP